MNPKPSVTVYFIFVVSMILGFAIARNFQNAFGMLFVAMMAVSLNWLMFLLICNWWRKQYTRRICFHVGAMFGASMCAVALELLVRMTWSSDYSNESVGFGGGVFPALVAFFMFPAAAGIVACHAFGRHDLVQPELRNKLYSVGTITMGGFEVMQFLLGLCSAAWMALVLVVDSRIAGDLFSIDNFFFWLFFAASGILHLFLGGVLWLTPLFWRAIGSFFGKPIVDHALIWSVLAALSLGLLCLICFFPEIEDGWLREGDSLAGGIQCWAFIFVLWGLLPIFCWPILMNTHQSDLR